MSETVLNPVISVRGLSKTYKVYDKPSDILTETLFRRSKFKEVPALTDINLDVFKGEVLGILGANGAGKTTFLKILCGVLQPTTGEVEVKGRISQMLELGTGFHPDYSGRENIYLGGYCQGMTTSDVESKFDDIVAFSELSEEEINRPFKTYSAGMQARLTFAVAIHVDAEILIVDEWLAVGDARFAVKCYDRIRKFREEGVTVIFVTHNYTTLTEFCDRGIVLAGGHKVFEGDPQSTITKYQEVLFSDPASVDEESSDAELETSTQDEIGDRSYFEAFAKLTKFNEEQRSGKQAIKLTGASLVNSAGKATTTLISGDPFQLIVEYTVRKTIQRPVAGFFIKNGMGNILCSTGTNLMADTPFPNTLRAGEVYTISYALDNPFAGGNYFFGMAIADPGGMQHDKVDNYFMFTVLPTPLVHTDVPINLNPKVSALKS